MKKKLFITIYLVVVGYAIYYSNEFYSKVNNNQNLIYMELQNNFLSTQAIAQNFLNSLATSANDLVSINDPLLLKAAVSENIMSVALLDKDMEFLYGFSLDSDQKETVHKLDTFEYPDFGKELGWIKIDLNSNLYTCRGYFVIQKDDLSYLAITFNLVPVIKAMGPLSYGLESYAFVNFSPKSRVISLFNFSTPGKFTRLLNSSIYFEAPLVTNWSFVFSGNWRDLYPYSISDIHNIFTLLVFWGTLFTLGSALLVNARFNKPASLWIPSFVFDSFCLLIVVFFFIDLPTTFKEVSERTSSFRNAQSLPKTIAILIPTSIYIESLSFPDDSSFLATGFITQIYPKNENLEIGFLFPNESILYSTTITEVTRWETEASVTILWQFCAGLTNTFSPVYFPFDKRSVRINLWPKEVLQDVVFFPNLLNYEDVNMQGLKNIDPRVDPSGWNIATNSYILEPRESYGFFGFAHLPISFQFAIILTRDFLGAFLSNIMVLTLCMVVAFLVLFIPNNTFLDSLFSTISIFVGLLFIAVTNHASLRNNLQTSSFAYIEYLFISFYVLILAITIDFIIRVSKKNLTNTGSEFRSILYWPIILGSFVLVLSLTIFK